MSLSIDERVAILEQEMGEMKEAFHSIAEDTRTIRSAIVGVTQTGIFLRKHGPRAVAFVVGCLVSGGWLSPTMFEHAKQAIAIIAQN